MCVHYIVCSAATGGESRCFISSKYTRLFVQARQIQAAARAIGFISELYAKATVNSDGMRISDTRMLTSRTNAHTLMSVCVCVACARKNETEKDQPLRRLTRKRSQFQTLPNETENMRLAEMEWIDNTSGWTFVAVNRES